MWVPEFWASDALTPLGYLAGQTSAIRLATRIVQLGARTPAMLAMSAHSLQALSGGRFVLGVGASGPQVMEGWHGVRFDRPVRRTRETIEVIRAITAGERLDYHGEIYELPLPGGERRSHPVAHAAHARPRLRRLARSRQPAPDRRAGRRLDRELVLPGDRRGVPRPDP
jgi:alkanesulfonate monooxygenase SsuD/methylene tetrahydromethanopterin reductase-like flavin-dependent oxidoreductase (luciferase family)